MKRLERRRQSEAGELLHVASRSSHLLAALIWHDTIDCVNQLCCMAYYRVYLWIGVMKMALKLQYYFRWKV